MQYQSGAVSPVESIQRGWDLIKSDYWVFFGMTTLMIVIVVVASLILSAINNFIAGGLASVLGMAATNANDIGKASAVIAPQLISMVIGIFVNIIIGALSGCLYCGIYAALSRKVNTGVADFSDLFTGFEKFQQCLIVAAILSVIQFVIGVVMLFTGVAFGVSAFGAGMLMGKDGMPDFAILSGILGVVLILGLIYLVITIILGALTTFIYPLIGERNLQGVEAVSLSVKAGFANIGGIILLLLLLGVMGFIGALACGIGILFVLPIMSAAIFAAYQSVFGTTSNQSNYSSPPPPPNFGNQPGY